MFHKVRDEVRKKMPTKAIGRWDRVSANVDWRFKPSTCINVKKGEISVFFCMFPNEIVSTRTTNCTSSALSDHPETRGN